MTPDVMSIARQAQSPGNPQAVSTQSPQITELSREPERYIPQTVHLQAIDLDKTAEPLQRIVFTLSDDRREQEIQVSLQTNNLDFSFVRSVVRLHFKDLLIA